MTKVMIFIDYQNFESSLNYYYDEKLKQKIPKLDYKLFPHELVNLVHNSRLVRTYLFFPRPDDFLMKDPSLKAKHDWVTGTLKNISYLHVIEGQYIARPVDPKIPMDITNYKTYYKVEKGTDINIATQMITKAFHNAYDVAMLVSGDSDYLPAVEQVNNLGKNVIAVGIKGQNISKLKNVTDDYKILDHAFFSKCIYKQ